MTYSLPRPTRPCRGVELFVRNEHAFFGAHSVHASAIFSDLFLLHAILFSEYFIDIHFFPACGFCEYRDPLQVFNIPHNFVMKHSVIRSFHSSALLTEYSPNAERLYSPSGHGTLHRGRVWATLECAERVAGVGMMRGLKDLPMDV